MIGAWLLGSVAALLLGLFLSVRSLRGYWLRLHELLEARTTAHLNLLNGISSSLKELSDRPADNGSELLPRIKSLELEVEQLPSIWDEAYKKVRRAEERERKLQERAEARAQEEEEEGEEVPPWEIAAAAREGGIEAPEGEGQGEPPYDPLTAVKLRKLGLA